MLLTYNEGSKKFKEKVFNHIKKKLNTKLEYLRVWIHTTSANNNPKRKSEDLTKNNSNNNFTKASLILIQKPDIKNPNYFNIESNNCIIKPDIKDKLKG